MDRMKVLIVDDEEKIAAIAKFVFDNMFDNEDIYHVETAGNSEEGYMVSLDFMPNIVLTDILMPGKNGIEMVRAIRKLNPGVRTIYMSGEWHRFQTSLEEEHAMHHVFLLKKPFNISELKQLLSDENTIWKIVETTGKIINDSELRN